MAKEQDLHAREALWELIWCSGISQCIHVAVQLGVPEILEARPRSAKDLAEITSSDPWALETVLRGLAAFDILSLGADDYFSLTSIGQMLLHSSPCSLTGEAGFFFETMYRPLGALLNMVKTGEVAFDQVYGMTFYEYLSQNPTVAAFFYDTMSSNAPSRYRDLPGLYDFAGVSRVVDVGGGEGSLMVQLLQACPHLRGAVFDLPMAIDRARGRIQAAQLSGRCEIIAGDFRHSVPSGADLYLLAQIINNWRDDDARRLLRNCRSAMGSNARLLILEPVYLAGSKTLPWRALTSVGVMAQRGGRTRTEAQLRTLLESAELRLDRIRPFPSGMTCAIEASPLAI